MLEMYVIGYVHCMGLHCIKYACRHGRIIDCNYNIHNNINTILCVITNYQIAMLTYIQLCGVE